MFEHRLSRFPVALLLSALFGTASAGIEFSTPSRIPAGDGPTAVASGEMTGDSRLDLIVVNRTTDDAWLYAGDGSGGFLVLGSFSVGNFPQGVVTADFDGDTVADIATTAVPFNSGTVSAWLGVGDGTFQLPEVLTADDGTRSVAAVDIDGDGLLDLLVTNPVRGNISTFLGDGDGTFGAETRSMVGAAASFPTDLAIADFNEDGDLDVVTSNAQSTDASLGLVLGNGDGSFGAPTSFPTTCQRPEALVAADFDGDQHVDVAVACFFSSDVVVMAGDGDGGLAGPQLYSLLPAGANPYWILAEDFDNDGVLDLVTSNNGSFSVLAGIGDGTFEAPRTRAAQPGTFFGADAADYDGDGWLDLAVANPGLDEVWVYLNTQGVCSAEPPYVEVDAALALHWNDGPDALGYDLVRGDIRSLRDSGGDFTAATEQCLAGLQPGTAYTPTENPEAGEGFWYLVREVTSLGQQSYDVPCGELAGTRDVEIAASGFDCP